MKSIPYIKNNLGIIPTLAILLSITVIIIANIVDNKILFLEITISVLVLFISIILAIRIHKINILISIVLCISYVVLEITWGSFVPYILLLPILSLLLLSTETGISAVPFAVTFSLFILLETMGILPLIKYPEIEMSNDNYIIILLLENTIFIGIGIYSRFLYLFNPLINRSPSITGILKKSSYFMQIIIKGLYNSVYIHFVNNLLNTFIWIEGDLRQEQLTILSYLSNTSKNEIPKHSIDKVVIAITSYFEKLNFHIDIVSLPDKKIEIPSSIVIPIIFDICQNCFKYKNTKVSIQGEVTVDSIVIKVTSLKTDEAQHISYSRSLGYAKEFLTLSNLGNLRIIEDIKFVKFSLGLINKPLSSPV